MSDKRNVVGARADDKGNITQVLLDNNSRFIPVQQAINMADRGELGNAHAVHKQDGSSYLRSNPDNTAQNNLDTMAGDT